MMPAAAAPTRPASSPRELQNARLRRDIEALAVLADQVSELDQRITTLERQSLRLADSLRVLRSERSVLSNRMITLSSEIRDVRRSLCPASLCTEDILRLIFAEQSRTEDPYWRTLGSGVFNGARARAPFSVAAVCATWRAAALSCPEIWTYIGIPDLSKLSVNAHACHTDRARILLSRSGAMPLDILIENISDSDLSAYTDILDLLYEQICRWRRCELFATARYPYFHKYLRGATPLLEQLHVNSPGMDEAPPTDSWAMAAARGYLSHCPRLRDAFLGFWMPFHLDSDRQSLQQLQTLTLELYQTGPSPLLWRLFASLPALSTLDLAIYNDPAVTSPSETFELPALRNLVLRAFAIAIPARFPASVRMGSVEHLELHFGAGETIDFGALAEFLDACAQSLRSVHIHELRLSAADGAALSRLNTIWELDLEDCAMSHECLLALRDGMDGLRLLRVLGSTTTFATEATIEAFIDLVREKCGPGRDRPRIGLFDAQVDTFCGLSHRDQLELGHVLSSQAER